MTNHSQSSDIDAIAANDDPELAHHPHQYHHHDHHDHGDEVLREEDAGMKQRNDFFKQEKGKINSMDQEISTEKTSWVSKIVPSSFQRPNENYYKPVELEDRDDENDNGVMIMSHLEIASDDPDIEIERTKSHEMQDTRKSSSWKDLIIAWLACGLAMIAGASVGPVFKYMAQQGIRPCLSASWRCQCMSLVLAPLAISETLYDKKNKVHWFSRKPDLQFPVIVHVIFSGLAWSGNLLFWIVALQYTTTFMASVIACSHPILLVIGLRITGATISWYEYGGVFISFTGMIISCLQDLFENSSKTEEGPVIDIHHQLLGYFLCLLSALCEVLVLFNRIKTKKYVPLMQYTFATTVVVTICATLSSILLERKGVIYMPLLADGTASVSIFCLKENCVFGWFSKKWFFTILIFGIWIGVFCISGFNYAMQYIAPLIFSALGLLDPALTAIISWVIGVESLPSIFSWVGGIVVMVGVGLISLAESHH